jgi:DNA-directed RNA polymerase beta' subunit
MRKSTRGDSVIGRYIASGGGAASSSKSSTGKTDIGINLGALFSAAPTITKKQANEIGAVSIKNGDLKQAIITSTSFHYMSQDEIINYSGDIVVDHYDEGTDPTVDLSGTPNDPRMGTIEGSKLCTTCGQTVLHCPNHPGRVELGIPFIHPEEIKAVCQILTSVCNSCSAVKNSEEELQRQGVLELHGRARLEAIAEKSKGVKCRNTLGSDRLDGHSDIKPCLINPEYNIARNVGNHVVTYSYVLRGEEGKKTVEKKKPIKKYKLGVVEDHCPPEDKDLTGAAQSSEEKEQKRLTIENKTNIRTIEEIKTIFRCISKKDLELLGFGGKAHPLSLVMESLLLIPPCARPQVSIDGVVRMDHLTTGYGDITKLSENLKLPSNRTNECRKRETARDLFFYVSHLIDNSDGKWTHRATEEVLAIKQRLTGKEGIPRMNIQGKRVNQGARSVITPSKDAALGWCEIPEIFFTILTVPVKVARFNIDMLNEKFKNGEIAMIVPGSGKRANQQLTVNDKVRKSNIRLQIGDVVHRYIEDGDPSLLNRQPTIHKYSMQGNKIKKVPWRTIRLHMMLTKAYNADFDGDEMNLHIPQTPEARAEALLLCNSENNLNSPHYNGSSIGAVFGVLIGMYQMTFGNHNLGCEKECYYVEKSFNERVKEAKAEHEGERVKAREKLLHQKRLYLAAFQGGEGAHNIHEDLAESIAEYKDEIKANDDYLKERLEAFEQEKREKIEAIYRDNMEYTETLWSEGMAVIQRLYPTTLFDSKEYVESVFEDERSIPYSQEENAARANNIFQIDERRAKARLIPVSDEKRRAEEAASLKERLQEAQKEHDLNPRSGRALFSALLPADFWYEKGDVKIRKGILLPGPCITKAHIGVSSYTIQQVMAKRYGLKRAAHFLSLLNFLGNWFVTRRGFTINHAHTALPPEDALRVSKLVRKEIEDVELKIRALGAEPLDPSALEKDSRERKIQGFLNNTKAVGDLIGEQVFDSFHPLVVMSVSGAKGNSANTAQVVGILGQQFVYGTRPSLSLTGGKRCCPYFDINSTDLAARGFISSNFVTGLTPPEFYFISLPARESLTDTATKIAEVGAILGKMVKVMEDVKISYTGANINAVGNIFQYINHDGFDPANMIDTKTAAGDVVSFIDLKESIGRINLAHGFDEYS